MFFYQQCTDHFRQSCDFALIWCRKVNSWSCPPLVHKSFGPLPDVHNGGHIWSLPHSWCHRAPLQEGDVLGLDDWRCLPNVCCLFVLPTLCRKGDIRDRNILNLWKIAFENCADPETAMELIRKEIENLPSLPDILSSSDSESDSESTPAVQVRVFCAKLIFLRFTSLPLRLLSRRLSQCQSSLSILPCLFGRRRKRCAITFSLTSRTAI